MVLRRRASEFTSLRQIAASEARRAAPWDLLVIFDAWTRATGTALSRITRPVEWDGRRLVVEVSDPVWLGSLEGMAPRIVESVNQHLAGSQEGSQERGAVSTIHFRPAGPRGGGEPA